MEVSLENLTKRWGTAIGTENITLDVKSGEFVAFLGPSGCGKTTTLLMVAGIYKPTEGFVKFDGRIVNRVQPKDRNIGMVFQSYALYPHMTVYDNLAFPMKLNKTPANEMKKRAQRVAELMGISHLMDRKPSQLSGGQQQRVALGRLTKEPGLLLFDEPLSNLDARLRSLDGVRSSLQLDLGITSIYVTHDQIEAMTMADRVAVMQGGHLQAYAPPGELYDQPINLFVASFVGNPPMNFMPVEVSRDNGSYHARGEASTRLSLPNGVLWQPWPRPSSWASAPKMSASFRQTIGKVSRVRFMLWSRWAAAIWWRSALARKRFMPWVIEKRTTTSVITSA